MRLNDMMIDNEEILDLKKGYSLLISYFEYLSL